MTKAFVIYKFNGTVMTSNFFDTLKEAEESIAQYIIPSPCVGTLNGYYETLASYHERLGAETNIIGASSTGITIKTNSLNERERGLWKFYLTTLLHYRYIKMDVDNFVYACDMNMNA